KLIMPARPAIWEFRPDLFSRITEHGRREAERAHRAEGSGCFLKNAVITDSEFQNHEPERSVLEKAGFRVIPYNCKTAEELKEAGREADAVLVQYAQITE